MGALVTVFVVLVVLVAAMHVLGRWSWGKASLPHLPHLEALLTAAAIVTAAVWYFVERPDSAKLNIELRPTAVSLDGRHVLLVSEVSLENAGSTVLDFRDTPYSVSVQKVRPLTTGPRDEFVSPPWPGHVRDVYPAEAWGLLAERRYPPQAHNVRDPGTRGLTSIMEAGEIEHFYYRVIVPCEAGLVLSVLAQVEKPYEGLDALLRRPAVTWRRQAIIDVSDKCCSAS